MGRLFRGPGAVLVCLSLLILGTATRAEAACDATWDCNNNVINDCIEGGAAISPTRDICGVTPTGYRLQSTFLGAAPAASAVTLSVRLESPDGTDNTRTIYLWDVPVGTLFGSAILACGTQVTEALIVPAATWNAAIVQGRGDVAVKSSGAAGAGDCLDCFPFPNPPENNMLVTASYTTAGDNNGNDVLDLCEFARCQQAPGAGGVLDGDGDGVADSCDVCPDSISGVTFVDDNGCTWPIAADDDQDGDVDLDDFDDLGSCLSGPGGALAPGCEGTDLDGDGDGDLHDLDLMQRCFSAAGTAADPECEGQKLDFFLFDDWGRTVGWHLARGWCVDHYGTNIAGVDLPHRAYERGFGASQDGPIELEQRAAFAAACTPADSSCWAPFIKNPQTVLASVAWGPTTYFPTQTTFDVTWNWNPAGNADYFAPGAGTNLLFEPECVARDKNQGYEWILTNCDNPVFDIDGVLCRTPTTCGDGVLQAASPEDCEIGDDSACVAAGGTCHYSSCTCIDSLQLSPVTTEPLTGCHGATGESHVWAFDILAGETVSVEASVALQLRCTTGYAYAPLPDDEHVFTVSATGACQVIVAKGPAGGGICGTPENYTLTVKRNGVNTTVHRAMDYVAPAPVGDLDLTVTTDTGMSVIDVLPDTTVSYRVEGQLTSTNNAGLAGLSFDLSYSGGALAAATISTSPLMAAFDSPDGAVNPAGFGGTVVGGDLIQVGGAQNTMNHTGTAPNGSVLTNVAQGGSQELVTGTVTAPMALGSYTVTPSSLSATLIRAGQTGTPTWRTIAAGPGTLTPLTIDVVACPANDPRPDTDSDGTSDLCDTCTDSDGDGWGEGGTSGNGTPLQISGCSGSTTVPDNCPNTANPTQANLDGDQAGDVCDCDMISPGVWSAPGAVGDLTISRSGGNVNLSWSHPAAPGSETAALAYDLARFQDPNGLTGLIWLECVDQIDQTFTEAEPPGDWNYLARVFQPCGENAGTSSSGTPRSLGNCQLPGACGNNICEFDEDPVTCANDCDNCNNDGFCDPNEHEDSCPADCFDPGFCGDLTCDPGEDPGNCGIDCPPDVCGNNFCEPGEDEFNCPQDCPP